FDIGEVLLKEDRHVGEQPSSFGHGPVGARLRPRRLALALAHPLRQPPHDLAMAHVPGNARELRGAIGEPRGESRYRADPALPPGWGITKYGAAGCPRPLPKSNGERSSEAVLACLVGLQLVERVANKKDLAGLRTRIDHNVTALAAINLFPKQI